MTNEEAIKILSQRGWDGLPCGYTGGYVEAIDMAVEALKQTAWIPVSERLPDKPKGKAWYHWYGKDIAADEHIVMIYGASQPTTLYWTGKEWIDVYSPLDDCEPMYRVVAWMPLPEPYKENI